ncbi:hypothetical protein PV336_21345 [Streptomyces sp. MI02-2A]|uniref:hypothetical protein n=1 Tax=Streptomyces sp. MI02-2A TaxID=3028688 RepID=UPI0029A8FED7|nr:hypothetical protein [Streptomyces sp. MI02-2A]MDX3261757.1 hypothetical protein [Streptomyces sp. MI02-2A]
MPTRTIAVTTAAVGAAVLVTAGITYASTTESTKAGPSAKLAAPAPHKAAPSLRTAMAPLEAVPAAAPQGGDTSGGGNNGNNSGNGGNGENNGGNNSGNNYNHGGNGGNGGNNDDHGDRGGGGDRGNHQKRIGRIYFNERSFSAAVDGCVPAASGLGSTSFSVDNDSDKIVEVYRGFSCDNGSPVATVGPYGSTYGVVTGNNDYSGDGGFGSRFGSGFAGALLDSAVAGSFRVIDRHHYEW